MEALDDQKNPKWMVNHRNEQIQMQKKQLKQQRVKEQYCSEDEDEIKQAKKMLKQTQKVNQVVGNF